MHVVAKAARPAWSLSLGLVFALGCGLGPVVGSTQAAAVETAPAAFADVRARYISSEAWVLDRHGHLLQSVRVDMTRRRLPWVALADLSPAMISSLIASEDKRFMTHTGVDWKAMVGAVWTNLVEKRQRGASTLTMQLVGLIDPSLRRDADGRSLDQKWRQIGAARDLEKHWSKEQILEAYLNLANFRGELAGIAAASKGLFGKHPSGLNQSEASILAALLRGPNATADVVGKRACGVIKQMGRTDCRAVTLLTHTALRGHKNMEVPGQLVPHLARRLNLAPGQSLRTSLDAELQSFALDVLKQHLLELRSRAVEDGAVLVLDNASGEVLAWVGASDTTSQAPEVDGVTALRLPGSTLKPFLYGLAIDSRLITAASPLDDSPLTLDTPIGQYVPQNYEQDFKGWVSTRNALGASLNVPAVRTLLLLGVERFHAGLLQLGLHSLKQDSEFYGYSLALGGGEVTLLELTNAYRSLANGGLLRPVTLLPVQTSGAGKSATGGQRVLSKETAYILSDILADKSARGLTFGLSSPLETSGWAAVKTGTSKDMRDNWCMGYTNRYTVGVWVGNASGAPMQDVSGISGAAPVWQAIMNRLQTQRSGPGLAQAPALPPKRPPGLETRHIAFDPAIEPARNEVFLAGTAQDRIVMPQADMPPPRIEGPGNGAILARDPDIPATLQHVRFRVSGGQEMMKKHGLQWYVDDTPADPRWLAHDGSLHWPLTPGPHHISLRTQSGHITDAMFITVK